LRSTPAWHRSAPTKWRSRNGEPKLAWLGLALIQAMKSLMFFTLAGNYRADGEAEVEHAQ
jgi:hypothetical protein